MKRKVNADFRWFFFFQFNSSLWILDRFVVGSSWLLLRIYKSLKKIKVLTCKTEGKRWGVSVMEGSSGQWELRVMCHSGGRTAPLCLGVCSCVCIWVHTPWNCCDEGVEEALVLNDTSISPPKRSDVNFREVPANCLQTGFWHFSDKLKAEVDRKRQKKIREGVWENRAAETYNISNVSVRHIYLMLITPLF